MAVIKVFDANGVRELHCFDNLKAVPYLDNETFFEKDPFDDLVDLQSE